MLCWNLRPPAANLHTEIAVALHHVGWKCDLLQILHCEGLLDRIKPHVFKVHRAFRGFAHHWQWCYVPWHFSISARANRIKTEHSWHSLLGSVCFHLQGLVFKLTRSSKTGLDGSGSNCSLATARSNWKVCNVPKSKVNPSVT